MSDARYFGRRTQGELARPKGSKFSDAARKRCLYRQIPHR